MSCERFQSRLSAYLDGELAQWTRWKVERHLRTCPRCTQAVREFCEIDLVLRNATCEVTSPAHLVPAIMVRIPLHPRAWRRRPKSVRWAAGLVLAGFQLVALYAFYRWGATYARTPVIGGNGNVMTAPAAINGQANSRSGQRDGYRWSNFSPASWNSGSLWGATCPASMEPEIVQPDTVSVNSKRALQPGRVKSRVHKQPVFSLEGVAR